MNKLTGKTALITGGSTGLGKAIATRFSEEGATVVIADINEEDGLAVARELKGQFIRTDVTDAAAVQQLVQQTVAYTGRLDILVNNAGIDGDQAPVHACTLEAWHQVINLNLNGVFYCMKYGLDQLLRQESGGVIINISSVAGLTGFQNAPSYCASKAAVVNLTRAAAVEYSSCNIRVNAIAPTAVITPLVEQHINASPDPAAMKAFIESTCRLPGLPAPGDIAALAAFLASDDARYISGITIPVDGAYTASVSTPGAAH